eukprot:g5841.t1
MNGRCAWSSSWSLKPSCKINLRSPSDVRSSKISHALRPRVKIREIKANASSGASDVFVLELDGVLVDSFRERAKCACHAATHLFPELISQNTEQYDTLIDSVAEVARSHSIPISDQIKIYKFLADSNSLEEQLTVQEILELNLQSDLPHEQLTNAIASARNKWIEEEEADWIGMHRAYPGIKDALASCSYPFYFTSSYPARISSMILRHVLEQEVPEDSPRLFTSPSVSKTASLKQIESRPLCQLESTRLHFVDSSPLTFTEMSAESYRRSWKLYYASWGYKDATRKAQAVQSGAKTLELKEFVELMKWGVVMGVDDGCEPTPEEVQDQVR